MHKILQNDLTDCGICCLKFIINYYHGDISLERLRRDTFTNGGGTNMYHLLETAKKYGFDGYGLKVNSISDLKSITLPAIGHFTIDDKYDHFMVITKIDKKHVYVMDPAKGNQKYSYEKFDQIWNKILLLLTPIHSDIIVYPTITLNKSIFEIIKDEKTLFLSMFIISIFLSIITIIISFFYKIFLSTGLNNYFTKFSILFIILAVFKIILTYLTNYLEIKLNKNIDYKLESNFLEHLFYLPSYSIKSRTTGEIISRINELSNYKSLVTDFILHGLLELISVLLSGVILFIINKQLLGILFCLIVFYLLIGLISNKKIQRKICLYLDNSTNFNNNLIENINNLDSLKNLHIENKSFISNANVFKKMLDSGSSLDSYLNYINVFKNIVNELGILLINFVGVFLIKNHELSMVDLLTFNTILVFFKEPLKNYIDLIPKLTFIKTSYQKLSEFYQIEKETFENQKNYFPQGNISLKDFTFSYDGVTSVVNNFNATIPLNQKTLLKGPSGSGKSSICRSIYGLIDNYKGSIYIGNKNIKDISLDSIRSNIGYVSQKEGLFSDTIYNNIVLNRTISDEEFKRIASICELDEIVDKRKLKYHTTLIEAGKNLSGGERQRIILARMLLKYPDVLILDEALSEVPLNMERRILANLTNYLKNKTLIYVSHRNLDYYFDHVIEINS